MNEDAILTGTKLRLQENCRWGRLEPGGRVVRSPARAEYLILHEREERQLKEGFSPPSTVAEALVRQLTGGGCRSLRAFYDLVLRAEAAGILIEAGAPAVESKATARTPRLPLAASRGAGILLSGAAVVTLGLFPWAHPTGWTQLVLGWLWACASLSLGNVWTAGVLAGANLAVLGWRFQWRAPFPHFRVEAGEAVLGGRTCEQAVAVVRLAPVLAGAGVLAALRSPALAPVLAAVLYVLAPWGASAAVQWLAARFDDDRFTIADRPLFQSDEWTRWRYRWLRLNSTIGRIRSAWWGFWTALVIVGLLFFWPVGRETVAAWIRADRHLPLLGRAAGWTGLTLAVFALCFAGHLAWQHWRIKRQWSRLPTATRSRGPGPAAQATDARSALRAMALFRALPDPALDAVAGALEVANYGAGATICAEDEPGDAFFVVLAGDLEVRKKPAGRKGRGSQVIGRLGPGDCFGEIALLEDVPRTATIRCASDCRLGRLPKENFTRCVLAQVGLQQVRLTLQAVSFLGRLTFLAGSSFSDLVNIAERCSWKTYGAGTPALRQRQPNNFFYLIFDGAFEARQGGQLLRRMGPGDYFGEISLLGSGDATADVTAIEEARCLLLHRNYFLEIFSRDYRLGLRMEAIAQERLARTPGG